ncbi:peptidoglycan-binding protein [Streptomyces longisporoflavus]|uniref:Peptidoglycan-binding protein n=1 Tax=Streptomyces longisporoflavus TaxID=28044 RepID=A0ABW7QJU9_9ACTN
MSHQAAAPDPSTYPALSSYLTRTSTRSLDRRRRTAFGAPAAGSEEKGRHRATASPRGRTRPQPRGRHGAARTGRIIPPLSYGYASAALLVLTAGLFAQSHGRPAPTHPQVAPPAQQPDTPRHESSPAPGRAPTTPAPPPPHQNPAPNRGHGTPPAHPTPAADSAASVLRPGSTGTSVRKLQEQLGRLRLYTGPVDGYYSHDVAAAVARMQQARAIDEPLGVYGPGTRTAISTAAM